MKYLIYLFILNCLCLQLSYAQCTEPDAGIWLNTWSSCNRSMNPFQEYGESHWIQYDFGVVRKLSKSWIWNTNDPSKLDQGFKTVTINYSLDGENWTNWGQMDFPKAQGQAIYGGFPGPDLVGVEARYVLITATSNHGHPSCFGLAEVKFNLLPPISEGPDLICSPSIIFEEVIVEEVFTTEAYIFWESEEDVFGFLFLYRKAEEEEWMEIETEGYEVFLEDLEPGTTYEFVIVTECGDEPIHTEIETFTTLEDPTTSTVDNLASKDQLRLFPNPTSSEFTLQYLSEKGGNIDYYITNTQGKQIMLIRQSVNPGINDTKIDLTNFPNGLYMVEAINEDLNNIITQRIIKLKQ